MTVAVTKTKAEQALTQNFEAVAAKLPGHAGVELATAARDAFISSLRLASFIAAIVVAGLAAVQTAMRRGAAAANTRRLPATPVRR